LSQTSTHTNMDSIEKIVGDDEVYSEEGDDEDNAAGTTASDDIIKYTNDPTL